MLVKTKNVRGMFKKAMACLLTLAMIVAMIPALALTAKAATAAEYQGWLDQISGYIDQAKEYKNREEVPAGGMYATLDDYRTALNDFIAKAERDLYIANALATGTVANNSYVSVWERLTGDLTDGYKRNVSSDNARRDEAIKFFKEGIYNRVIGVIYPVIAGTIGYQSAFHPNYDNYVLGLLTKVNVVEIMRDTITALEKGNKLMTGEELAEYNYNQERNRLLALRDDPSAIIDDILSSDETLETFVEDLNSVLDSIDSIISIIDIVERLGIGANILDPLLSQFGISYAQIQQIAGLRKTLEEAGINISGDADVETALEPLVRSVVGEIINGALQTAEDGLELVGRNQITYGIATSGLKTAYDGLINLASEGLSSALNAIMGPISSILEYAIPIIDEIENVLAMLEALESLVNDVNALIESYKTLANDVSFGNVSVTTDKLADVLDDLADFLESYGNSQVMSWLTGWILDADLGGTITDSLAKILNDYVNGAIGSDVLDLTGDDLSIIKDTADSLTETALSNIEKLIEPLRKTADVLRHAAGIAGGIQNLIDGDYQEALDALVGKYMGQGVADDLWALWNDLNTLYNGDWTDAIDLLNKYGIIDSEAISNALIERAKEVAIILTDAAKSYQQKVAALKDFLDYLGEVSKWINEVRETISDIESAIDQAKKWADSNLTEEAAKDFAETIARHYLEKLAANIRDSLKGSAQDMWEKLSELRDGLSDIYDYAKKIYEKVEAVKSAIERVQDADIKGYLKAELKNIVDYYLDELKDCLKGSLNGIGEAAKAKLESIYGDLSDLYGYIKTICDKLDYIKSAIELVNDSNIKGHLKDLLKQVAEHYLGELKDCLSGSLNGIGETVKTKLESICDELSGLYDFIRNINIAPLKIKATPNEGDGDHYYSFTTNYDEEISKLAKKFSDVFEKLGISLEYSVNYPVGFSIVNGNELVETGLEAGTTHKVMVAYQLLFKVGYVDVKITLDTKEVDVTVKGTTPTEPVLEYIEISTQPTKTDYIVGDKLDLDGMVVTAYYSDGTNKKITDYTTTPDSSDELTLGDGTVAVMYEGKTAEFAITVGELTGIKITVEPDKMVYEVGDTLDLTGMVVTATYSNGLSYEITNYTSDPGNGATLNEENAGLTVTVSYEGYSDTFEIEVGPSGGVDKQVVSIAVTREPDKTVYLQGEELDLTGLIVTATYDIGDTEEVTNYTTNPAEGRVLNDLGEITVTVTHAGKEATFTITVNPAPVVLADIVVTTLPTTTTYTAGNTLNLAGMVVTATYSDGSSKAVTGYTTVPANSSILNTTGTITVTVTYVEDGVTETASFTITVNSGGGTGPVGPVGPGSGGTTTNNDEVTIDDEEIALAEPSSYAKELYKLGLFKGIDVDENGEPVFGLELELTRIQALILTIRLLGLEEEALDCDEDIPFTDVPTWAVPYVAFGYAKGITNGISADKFGTDLPVTCQQFTVFMLRVLGYNEKNGDFEYDGALDKALEVLLYTQDVLEEISEGAFLRGDAVVAMVKALLTLINSSDDTMLLDTLVKAELFSQEAADEFIEAIARIDEFGF